MWFFILLLIPNAYAVDCTDENYDLQQIMSLQIDFDDHIAFLISKGLSEEKARELAIYDPEGIQLRSALSCSGLFFDYSSNSQEYDLSWIPIAVVAGAASFASAFFAARYTITNSEQTRVDNIKEKGEETIRSALLDVDSTLKKKRSFYDKKTKSTLPYVNQKFSLTPFESVISSGFFPYFSTNLQKNLDGLCFRLEIHNQQLGDLEQLHVKADTETLLPKTRDVLIDMMLQLIINEKKIIKYYNAVDLILNPR